MPGVATIVFAFDQQWDIGTSPRRGYLDVRDPATASLSGSSGSRGKRPSGAAVRRGSSARAKRPPSVDVQD